MTEIKDLELEADLAIEELINGLNEFEKPIGKRGRPAKLSRAQVEHVQTHELSTRKMAKEMGVSPATIQRAREHGYRTAAENGAHSYVTRAPDRRRLHPDELRAIAEDTRPASKVAAEYNISRAYVYTLRTKFNGPPPPKGLLPQEVIDYIVTSHMDNEALARRFDLSPTIVRLVRRDYGEQK